MLQSNMVWRVHNVFRLGVDQTGCIGVSLDRHPSSDSAEQVLINQFLGLRNTLQVKAEEREGQKGPRKSMACWHCRLYSCDIESFAPRVEKARASLSSKDHLSGRWKMEAEFLEYPIIPDLPCTGHVAIQG